jgi:uncharacterized membrane protein (DUF373 family)
MHSQSNSIAMVTPSLGTRVRIARRRIVLTWAESEWLQPAAICALILVVLLAPIVYVLIEVW